MCKRIHISFLIVFLILAICPLAVASSDCDFSYSNYARAVQLHDMGDYDAALRHYHCALEEDLDDAVIPLLIANLHEDIANAGRAWSSAASPTTAEILDLPPLSTWGERQRPNRDQDFEDLIVAESLPSQRLPRSAAFAEARLSISIGRSGETLWLFYASGNRGAWLVQRLYATTKNGPVARDEDLSSADDFVKNARIFVRNLDWARARIRFEQALELDANRVDIRCELGMVYQELGDERAALRQFDIVLAQDPVDACARPNRDALMRRMRDG